MEMTDVSQMKQHVVHFENLNKKKKGKLLKY